MDCPKGIVHRHNDCCIDSRVGCASEHEKETQNTINGNGALYDLLIAAYILHVKSGYPMQMWIVQGILLIGVIAAALIVVWAALPSMKKRSKILLTATVLSAIILFLAFILYMAFGG